MNTDAYLATADEDEDTVYLFDCLSCCSAAVTAMPLVRLDL